VLPAKRQFTAKVTEDVKECFGNHLRQGSERIRRIGRIDSVSSKERQSLP